MKNSIIVTVFNEEKSVGSLIGSILNQTELPDEVIFVDGGSSDKTVLSIKNKVSSVKRPTFRVYTKKGNRSVGRNEAIRRSESELIAITDAGCILDKNWLKNILKVFNDKSVDVVAGYYKAKAHSVFQKCLVPYVLVMPDKVNPNNFLPATRSMALRKSVWKKIGGFSEKLSNNEDYAFARKVAKEGFKIKFARNAIVYWMPRANLLQSFKMFFRFAMGDAEAGILRPKVVLLFIRYFIAFYLLFTINYLLFTILTAAYFVWAILKNYKYVKDKGALIILPTLQLTSDLAVISGTIVGFARL